MENESGKLERVLVVDGLEVAVGTKGLRLELFHRELGVLLSWYYDGGVRGRYLHQAEQWLCVRGNSTFIE